MALQIKHAVNVAAMADRCDGDDAGTVIHEVDHPVVAGAHAQVGPVTGESSHAWRSGIDGQAVDNLGNSLAGERVKLPQRAAARGGISIAGRPRQAALQAEFALGLIPGNGLAGLVHGDVGLRSVLRILSATERLDHRIRHEQGAASRRRSGG